MARGRMRRGPGAPVEKAKDFKGTMKKGIKQKHFSPQNTH